MVIYSRLETVKKTKYYLDIEPELRNRVKAFAALKGKTCGTG
jgi:hypothetical protein